MLNVGKLDPLLWLPADDLLIEGANDILQFLSGEDELVKRPVVRPPRDGDRWCRSVPVGICFQRARYQLPFEGLCLCSPGRRLRKRNRKSLVEGLKTLGGRGRCGGYGRWCRNGGAWGTKGWDPDPLLVDLLPTAQRVLSPESRISTVVPAK